MRLYLSFFLCLSTLCVAQEDTTRLFVEAGGVAATSQRTPFWLRANQFGTVPLENPFVFVKAGGQALIGKNPRKPQLHLQTEIVANAGHTSLVVLPVAAATFRYRRFEAYVGRRKEFFGFGDTLLTSGSYAWSGNALPLPKVQVGTRGFVPLGFTKGLFAVHAMMAHGWFINADSVKNSFLHQKAVYIRFGKPTWKVHFYGGVHHLAQWGGQWRNPVKGSIVTLDYGKLPSDLAAFISVFKASESTNVNSISIFDAANRIGNHLGSIDLSTVIHSKSSEWLLYIQHPYEDKSGVVFINMMDGLYGLRWKDKNNNLTSTFRLRQFTVELLNTMNQSGFQADIGRRLHEGADDYFTNYQYPEGWSYRNRIIGTPFITRRDDARPEWYSVKGGRQNEQQPMPISNNRIQMLHVALLGTIGTDIHFKCLASQSWNYGRPQYQDPVFPLAQFSGLFQLSKSLKKYPKIVICISLALDKGLWLPSNFGGKISLKRSFSR